MQSTSSSRLPGSTNPALQQGSEASSLPDTTTTAVSQLAQQPEQSSAGNTALSERVAAKTTADLPDMSSLESTYPGKVSDRSGLRGHTASLRMAYQCLSSEQKSSLVKKLVANEFIGSKTARLLPNADQANWPQQLNFAANSSSKTMAEFIKVLIDIGGKPVWERLSEKIDDIKLGSELRAKYAGKTDQIKKKEGPIRRAFGKATVEQCCLLADMLIQLEKIIPTEHDKLISLVTGQEGKIGYVSELLSILERRTTSYTLLADLIRKTGAENTFTALPRLS